MMLVAIQKLWSKVEWNRNMGKPQNVQFYRLNEKQQGGCGGFVGKG